MQSNPDPDPDPTPDPTPDPNPDPTPTPNPTPRQVVFLMQSQPRRALLRRMPAAGGAPEEPVEASTIFDAAAGTLTVRQPGVRIGEAFSLELVE